MDSAHRIPPLFPRGTFSGIPARFRGWCITASQGGSNGGYHWVGRRFGEELLSLEPHDLESEEWLTLVHRMVAQCIDPRMQGEPLQGDTLVDREALTTWLYRHFPRMMKLIPKARLQRFIDGIVEAYDEGEMLDDFPNDFEPVEVDLDDPCCGQGYIRAYFQRPSPREVIYQCPAPSCREASRSAVEAYAKKNGYPIVDLGDAIATVHDIDMMRT